MGLTKRDVDAALPKASSYILFDNEVVGFGLRVYPTGRKVWIFEYRPNGGGRRQNKKRCKIGQTTELTPNEARKQAVKLRSLVIMGGDPQSDKAEIRAAVTVKELSQKFLTNHIIPKRKPTTASGYAEAINLHIIPALGGLKADAVTRVDIESFHNKLKPIPSAANKALAVASSMFSYGMDMKIIKKRENPSAGIEKFSESPSQRFLSISELERLGAALDEAATVGIPWNIDTSKKTKHLGNRKHATTVSPHAVAAIRLYILTGARLREILNLTWAQVDLEQKVIHLKDSKGGQRDISLGQNAIEVLRNLKRIGKFVIASDTAGQIDEAPRSDLKRPWTNIRRHANLEDVRIHDLRHTFASHGVINRLGLALVSKLLGHKNIATTMRYAHLEDETLKQGADELGQKLDGALTATK